MTIDAGDRRFCRAAFRIRSKLFRVLRARSFTLRPAASKVIFVTRRTGRQTGASDYVPLLSIPEMVRVGQPVRSDVVA